MAQGKGKGTVKGNEKGTAEGEGKGMGTAEGKRKGMGMVEVGLTGSLLCGRVRLRARMR